MSKITAIQISHHLLPLDPAFHASWDTEPRRRFHATIVRVQTDSGIEGVGSGDMMLGFEGHEHLFIGQELEDMDRHFQVLSNLQFHYGRMWPLDIALWDALGKERGFPCHSLLGGRSKAVTTYASSGTLRSPDEMADTAEAMLKRGFPAMKIRFQRGHWKADIEALEAVRNRVGSSLTLMVDCNQGWRMPWDTQAPWNLKTALAVGRELERLSVFWMEEPLHRSDYAGMRNLRQRLSLRIAGGEMNRELHEYQTLIKEECLDVYQPDAALIGGITGLKRLAQQLEDQKLEFTPHTWTNGIGVLANAHLVAGACSQVYMEFPFDPPEWDVHRRDFMLETPSETDAKGMLHLSDRPGLGFTLDEDRLEETRIG